MLYLGLTRDAKIKLLTKAAYLIITQTHSFTLCHCRHAKRTDIRMRQQIEAQEGSHSENSSPPRQKAQSTVPAPGMENGQSDDGGILFHKNR